MGDPRFIPGTAPLPKTNVGGVNAIPAPKPIDRNQVAVNINKTNEQITKVRQESQKKIDKSWVKFGNDRLNINTTSAKGLEKAIGVIAKFIIKVQGKVNEIFYGKFSSATPSRNLIKKLLDKGVIKLLEGIASVDLCNIFNYAISQIPGGVPFNPNEPPPTDDVLARKKWQIQKIAFDTQQFIDKYYRDYVDSNNPESKVGLFILIQQIKQALGDTVLSPSQGINDPQLKQKFPQLGTASNFLQNGIGYLDKYTDVRQIDNAEVQRIISTIDIIRQYCILIQAVNTPKDAISLIDSSLNLGLQQELEDFSQLVINPEKTTVVIKSVVKTVNTINDIGLKVLGYVQTLQVITTIAILLIRVYNIIAAFFIALPIPNITTSVGVTTKFSDIYKTKLKEQGEKRLIERLEQISAVINLIAILATSIVAAVQNIISKLEVMLLNLESCTNKDVGLINEISATINNLTKTAAKLQEFLDRYNSQQQQAESRFGNYTISIVTEEVVDEGINLRRRYGIAKDSNQYIVVQSTPTFASLDLIIINEVKVLLVSKGLVNIGLSTLSPDDQVTISDAARFLGIDDLNLDNLALSLADLETFADQDDELGISTFVNNLPGGRALRRRIREKMIKNGRSLGANLKASDPQGKYTSSIQKQTTQQTNKLEIEKLEDKIKDWKREIALAVTQGLAGALIIKDRTQKIKEAEKRIQQLKQG